MEFNWCNSAENHKDSIPADILYLTQRWCEKTKKILIVGGKSKFVPIFSHLKITSWDLKKLVEQSKSSNKISFDYILCYHSLSELNLQQCKKILLFLCDILRPEGEIYLTLLSKDSYFYKNKIKTDNNLYVNQNDLKALLHPFAIKNIEYTKRLKPDRKTNPHFYILASK